MVGARTIEKLPSIICNMNVGYDLIIAYYCHIRPILTNSNQFKLDMLLAILHEAFEHCGAC